MDSLSNNTYIDSLITKDFLARPWEEIGPTVVPWPIDSFFLGCIICQLINYQTSSARLLDSRFIKLLVAFVGAVGFATSGLSWRWSASAVLTYTSHYWPYIACTYITPFYIVAAVQAVCVQGFFAHKAFEAYNKQWAIIGVAGLLGILELVGGVGSAVKLSMIHTLLENDSAINRILANLFYFSSMGLNLGLFGLLFMSSIKGWTGLTVNNVVFMIYESLLPITLFTFITAIHFGATDSLTLAIPFLQLSGKLYAVSFLYSLNARAANLEDGTGSQSQSQSQSHSNTMLDALASRHGGDKSVNVAVETYVEVSEDRVAPERRRHAGLRDDDEDSEEHKEIDFDEIIGAGDPLEYRNRSHLSELEEGRDEEKYNYSSTSREDLVTKK